MIRSTILALVLVLLAPIACSAAEPDLTGTWSGYWVSDSNGHRGPISAKFTPVSDTTYKVRFRGRFWVVFPFRYSTTLNVVGSGEDAVMLAGEKNLGPLLGSFRTSATATATDFTADFSARRDTGRFIMTRRSSR